MARPLEFRRGTEVFTHSGRSHQQPFQRSFPSEVAAILEPTIARVVELVLSSELRDAAMQAVAAMPGIGRIGKIAKTVVEC